MAARKTVDWDAVEPHYRAGIRALKDIGTEFGVSDAAIIKHAKSFGWVRNLKEKIQALADAKVSAKMVSASVSAAKTLTEAARIELDAETMATVRISHRRDITRMRLLVLRLLSECEAEAGDVDALEGLGELLRNPDDKGQGRLNDAYQKAISLPVRIKGVKELADTMRILVAMEREAYGIGVVPEGPADDRPADMVATARQVAFILQAGLASGQRAAH